MLLSLDQLEFTCARSPIIEDEDATMTKVMGIGMAVLGFVLMAGSVASLNLPEIKQWFLVLLIGGAAAVYFGVKKYRWG
jgi:hypothetical protein